MRNHTKIALLVCLSIIALLLAFGVSCAMKAVPKKPGKVYGKSRTIAEQTKPSDYHLLLEKYKKHIDEIAEKRDKDSAQLYRDSQQAERSEQDTRAKAFKVEAESERLGKLRNLSKNLHGRKLLAVQPSPYLVESVEPTSDSSARIFGQLLKEDMVEPSVLMSMLHRHVDSLSRGWIDNAKYVAETSKPDSEDQRWGARVLYKAGIEKSKWRPVLERAAQQKDDSMALQDLFFETDKKTGLRRPIRSDENSALMNNLLKASSSFDIKVTCADYAADIGNIALAEDLCCKILTTQYKALSRPPSNEHYPGEEEDYALGRSKTVAMLVLFYKVKSEKGFRQIYDLSRLPQTEQENKDKMPEGWITCTAYAICRLDIDLARSFIQGVRSYAK